MPGPVTYRRHPSTGLAHAGQVWTDADTQGRLWVPICGIAYSESTAFWDTSVDHPTCLRCITSRRFT